MKHGFRAFDSDMHVYDPAFLYEKYMNPKWGDRIPRGERNGKFVERAVAPGWIEFKSAIDQGFNFRQARQQGDIVA